MDPTQRTRKFTATALLQPGEKATTLQEIFYKVGTRIQKAIDDNRTYTVKITTIITVDPMQAEIGELVTPIHFRPKQYQDDPILKDPNAHYEKRVFQPTL